MRQRLLHGLVLATLLLALFAIPARADGTPYTDPLGRFTFTPPDGLTLNTKGSTGGTVVYSNADQHTNVRIYTFMVTDNQNVDDYINYTIANGKKANFEYPSDPQVATLDGQPARQEDFFITDSAGRYHWQMIYAVVGNIVSHLDAWAPDTGWDAFAPQAMAAFGGFHLLTATYPTTFNDLQGRYTVTLPPAWQRDLSASKDDGTVDRFIGFDPAGDVQIDTMPIPAGITLDQYAASSIVNNTKADTTIQTDQTSATPTMVGGLPGFQWEYFNTANNARFHHRLIWLYNGPTRFRLSINVRDDRWDAFLPQAMSFITAFAFTPPPTA